MKYLVDVNLPKYFSHFNSDDFTFVADIDLFLHDNQIWEYALKHNLTILTKDVDFYHKSLLNSNRPKIIHFKLGNQKLSNLHSYFNEHWKELQFLIQQHELIIAHTDGLEIVI
jgi:predicted nuclease of predicted toxin-antitoxin system